MLPLSPVPARLVTAVLSSQFPVLRRGRELQLHVLVFDDARWRNQTHSFGGKDWFVVTSPEGFQPAKRLEKRRADLIEQQLITDLQHRFQVGRSEARTGVFVHVAAQFRDALCRQRKADCIRMSSITSEEPGA